MKKRPFASEGHLRLPPELAPEPTPSAAEPGLLAPCVPSPGASSTGSYSPGAPSPGASAPGRPPPGAPARFLGHAPFDPGGRTRTAEVLSDVMSTHGLRAGDRLVVVVREEPEFGDLVALTSPGDELAGTLWKAYPEAGVLQLRSGNEQLALAQETTPKHGPQLAGVIVAVRRALGP